MSALALLQAAADTIAPVADTVLTAAQRLDAARAGLDTPIAARLMGVVGLAVMIGLAVLLSYDRRRIPWRLVAIGLGIQLVFGVIVLKFGPGRAFFDVVTRLPGFSPSP